MNQPHEIIITLPRDPSKGLQVKVEGYSGPDCKKLTEPFEQVGRITKVEETAEFYKTEPLLKEKDRLLE